MSKSYDWSDAMMYSAILFVVAAVVTATYFGYCERVAYEKVEVERQSGAVEAAYRRGLRDGDQRSLDGAVDIGHAYWVKNGRVWSPWLDDGRYGTTGDAGRSFVWIHCEVEDK